MSDSSRLPNSAPLICAVAIVRDENPFLDEWIAYHHLLGIDHFFLYDVYWDFSITNPGGAPCDGFFVQKVDVYCNIDTSCDYCSETRSPVTPTFTYYEEWPVTQGQWLWDGEAFGGGVYTDTAGGGDNFTGCGSYMQLGTVKYFCKDPLIGGVGPLGDPAPNNQPSDLWHPLPANTYYRSGPCSTSPLDLATTQNKPAWWNHANVDPPTAQRWFGVKFNCCPNCLYNFEIANAYPK